MPVFKFRGEGTDWFKIIKRQQYFKYKAFKGQYMWYTIAACWILNPLGSPAKGHSEYYACELRSEKWGCNLPTLDNNRQKLVTDRVCNFHGQDLRLSLWRTRYACDCRIKKKIGRQIGATSIYVPTLMCEEILIMTQRTHFLMQVGKEQEDVIEGYSLKRGKSCVL